VIKYHPGEGLQTADRTRRNAARSGQRFRPDYSGVGRWNSHCKPRRPPSKPGARSAMTSAWGVCSIERFEITDVIAKSGMASLFKAKDRQTGKAVAGHLSLTAHTEAASYLSRSGVSGFPRIRDVISPLFRVPISFIFTDSLAVISALGNHSDPVRERSAGRVWGPTHLTFGISSALLLGAHVYLLYTVDLSHFAKGHALAPDLFLRPHRATTFVSCST